MTEAHRQHRAGELTGFQLRNVPLLSRVGVDRAEALRTDADAALAGWPDALLLRVDRRNQVLISDGQVVLGQAAKLGDKPPRERRVPGPAGRRPARVGDSRRT